MPMNKPTLDEAVEAAREFLKAAEAVKNYTSGIQTAAVRRKSMDLTRKLAELRRHS